MLDGRFSIRVLEAGYCVFPTYPPPPPRLTPPVNPQNPPHHASLSHSPQKSRQITPKAPSPPPPPNPQDTSSSISITIESVGYKHQHPPNLFANLTADPDPGPRASPALWAYNHLTLHDSTPTSQTLTTKLRETLRIPNAVTHTTLLLATPSFSVLPTLKNSLKKWHGGGSFQRGERFMSVEDIIAWF